MGPSQPRKASHVCPLCPRTFTRKANLNDHINSTHEFNAVKLPCSRCSKTFLRKSDRDRHERLQHGEHLYICGQLPGHNGVGCQRAFARRDALKEHRNSRQCVGARDGASALAHFSNAISEVTNSATKQIRQRRSTRTTRISGASSRSKAPARTDNIAAVKEAFKKWSTDGGLASVFGQSGLPGTMNVDTNHGNLVDERGMRRPPALPLPPPPPLFADRREESSIREMFDYFSYPGATSTTQITALDLATPPRLTSGTTSLTMESRSDRIHKFVNDKDEPWYPSTMAPTASSPSKKITLPPLRMPSNGNDSQLEHRERPTSKPAWRFSPSMFSPAFYIKEKFSGPSTAPMNLKTSIGLTSDQESTSKSLAVPTVPTVPTTMEEWFKFYNIAEPLPW